MGVEAAAADRLPWLSDEPAPTKRASRAGSIAAAGSVIMVAAAGFWFGTRSVDEQPAQPAPRVAASTTVRLPEPRPAQPEQITLVPAPRIEPIVAPPIPIVDEAPPVRHHAPSVRSHMAPETPQPERSTATIAKTDQLQPWPVRVIEGASGRLVRIGAFATPHQAKRGWWAITRMNPALKRLPALVVPVQSLRNGQVYYRLQMGTTSQAHSAVLCQRMRMIAQSCVVIGTSATTV
jgi:hypothetical protein